MFRFLHAADIHLDSPRQGLDRDPDAPADDIRRAPRRALENLVDLAVAEQVAFVLIAGDLYDGDWKDYRTGLFFIEQMVRLRDAEIPVFVIAGNHDAANRMTRTLNLPDNVTLFDHARPETVVLDEYGVAIHGQSFAKPAVHDDLSQEYPAARQGLFNIGLLHTCATKSGDHEPYAPCTIEGLRRREYDYWALGHVHKREQLQPDGGPPIVFPGNLQGRNIRESGAKGCYLVTVGSDGAATLEFRPLDVFRWQPCPVDAAGASDADEILNRCAGRLRELLRHGAGRPLAVRVEIVGACPAHQQLAAEPKRWQSEIQSAALQLGGGQIWIERVVRQTRLPEQLDASREHEGAIGELIEFIRELQQTDEELAALAGELAGLETQLPAELSEGADRLELSSPDRMRMMLDDVRELLIQRLHTHGGKA